jgi:predicted RNA-binding Zn-ribbon protein involved in translation (DUF1610 family)
MYPCKDCIVLTVCDRRKAKCPRIEGMELYNWNPIELCPLCGNILCTPKRIASEEYKCPVCSFKHIRYVDTYTL